MLCIMQTWKHFAVMKKPTPKTQETITLELSPLPDQTQQDLIANATLRRIKPEDLIAQLVSKKLGGVFTVKAVRAA